MKRWLVACTAGELLGFGLTALWAFLAFRLFGTDPESTGARVGVLLLMVGAGVCEGAVLGAFQWNVLRHLFPRLRARAWIGATVSVTALGWFVGMLPSTLLSPGVTDSSAPPWEPPLYGVLLGALAFGALAGAAFGFAQWLVLRHHAAGAHRWITANALGWAIGLPWSYLAGSLGDIEKSVPRAVVLGATAGALMGASVALVTGLALRRLAPRDRNDDDGVRGPNCASPASLPS